MRPWLISSFFLVAFAGCLPGDPTLLKLRVPYDEALVIAVSRDGESIAHEHASSGAFVGLEVSTHDIVTFAVPDEWFATSDGAPVSLAGVAARLLPSAAPQGSCEHCSQARASFPWVVGPGSDCALPAQTPAFDGEEPADETLVAQLRERIRLDWSGPCGCDAETPRKRGPFRPIESDWPVRNAAQLASGETLLVGRHVLRTSSAGVVRDALQADQCGKEELGFNVRVVAPLRTGGALVFGTDDERGVIVSELDPTTLSLSERAVSTGALELWTADEREGRVVLGGKSVFADWAIGTALACELAGQRVECAPVVSAGGINSRITLVALAGSGFLASGGQYLLAISEWPEISGLPSLPVEADLSPASTVLAGGKSIPVWHYANTEDFQGSIRALGGTSERGFACVDDSSGLELFSVSMTGSARPELQSAGSCPSLRCAAIVDAFGSGALLATGDGQLHLIPIDSAGLLEPTCSGRVLSEVRGLQNVHAAGDHLLLVDHGRRVARLDSWDGPIEWLARGPASPFFHIEAGVDGVVAYRQDGEVFALAGGRTESLGKIEASGLLRAATRSALGQTLVVSRSSGDLIVEMAQSTASGFSMQQLAVGKGKGNIRIRARWMTPDTALITSGSALFRLRAEVLTDIQVDWDDPSTEDVEGPFEIERLAGDASLALASGLRRTLSIDLFVDPPTAQLLRPRVNGPGDFGITQETISTAGVHQLQPRCPGRVWMAVADDRIAEADVLADGRLLVRPLDQLPTVGLTISNLTPGGSAPELGLRRPFWEAGGALQAAGQPLAPSDVEFEELVATEDALIALGSDGALYESSPCR